MTRMRFSAGTHVVQLKGGIKITFENKLWESMCIPMCFIRSYSRELAPLFARFDMSKVGDHYISGFIQEIIYEEYEYIQLVVCGCSSKSEITYTFQL